MVASESSVKRSTRPPISLSFEIDPQLEDLRRTLVGHVGGSVHAERGVAHGLDLLTGRQGVGRVGRALPGLPELLDLGLDGRRRVDQLGPARGVVEGELLEAGRVTGQGPDDLVDVVDDALGLLLELRPDLVVRSSRWPARRRQRSARPRSASGWGTGCSPQSKWLAASLSTLAILFSSPHTLSKSSSQRLPTSSSELVVVSDVGHLPGNLFLSWSADSAAVLSTPS